MAKRTHWARRGCAGAAVALLLAVTPAAASAGHGDARGAWGRRHDAHAGGHAHGHRKCAHHPPHRAGVRGHPHPHAPVHLDRHGPGGKGRGVDVGRHYGCRPCGRHFASVDLLRSHVHRHHRVASKLPLVIVASGAGSAFHDWRAGAR